jgi:hypothetical protein
VTDQNTTHSPRIDDQLAHDAEALLRGAPDDGRQEWRRDQVGGEGEPEVVTDRDESDRELDERSILAAALRPSAFPGTGATLADLAEEAHASPDRVAALRSLPEGRIFQTFAEVWTELGGEIEHRS